MQWTLQDDLALLQCLAGKEVEDEEEVEWGEMCEGWDSARSPYYLRMRWSMLRRDVPNYRLKTFQGHSSMYNYVWIVLSALLIYPACSNMPMLLLCMPDDASFFATENLEYLLTYRVPVLERQQTGVEHTSGHDHL